MAKIVSVNAEIEYINVIISNIYGAGEESERFFNTTLRKMMNHEKIPLTHGEQMYDFIYVSDAVRAIILAGKTVNNFKIQDLSIEGVKLITPFYAEDSRGYFLKSMEKDVFKNWGLDAEIYEDFETYSRKGVIRRLHFQTKNPQIKIVRAIKGTIHDVVVDLRMALKFCQRIFWSHINVSENT